MIDKLKQLHSSSKNFVMFIVIAELFLIYSFAGLAIDRGNLWWYLITIYLLVSLIKDLFRLIRMTFNGHKTAKTA